MKTLNFCLILVCLLFSNPARAADQKAGLQRWNQLSPEEKDRALKNYQLWKNLSPERQKELFEKYKVFKAQHPKRLERMMRNYKNFKALSPEEQEKFLQIVKERRGLNDRQIKRRLRKRELIEKFEQEGLNNSAPKK